MGELVFLLLLLILCAVCFVQTLSFPVSILDQSGGPALFPQIVLVLLAVVIVLRMIQFLREKEHAHFVFRELFTGRRLFFFGSLIVYVLLFQWLGYILSTALFLLVTVNYFYFVVKGNRGSVKAIVVRNVSGRVQHCHVCFFRQHPAHHAADRPAVCITRGREQDA